MQDVRPRAIRQPVDTRQSVRLNNEKPATANVRDATEFTGLRNLSDAKNSPVCCPQVFFVLAPDKAFEVETPNNILGLGEIQRGEGNPHCCCPALVGDSGGGSPNTIPPRVIVLPFGVAFFCNQTVALSAKWIDLENISITAIVRGIDENFKIVVEVLGQIPAQFGG